MVDAERFDVAVLGAGTAGLAAAIGAARLGARTLLIERSTVIGGNASQAYVHTICGLYRSAEEGDARLANPGFAAEFARRLQAAGAAGTPEKAGRVWVLPTYPASIPALAEKLCAEVPALEVRMGTTLVGATLSRGDEPHELYLRGAAGESRVHAGLAVDASGDSWLAALGGAETEQTPANELQVPAFIFRLSGVETRHLEGFGRLRVTHAVASAARSGELPEACSSALVRQGRDPGEVYVTLNIARPADYAPLDDERLADLQAHAQRDAEKLARFLRETRSEFADSEVLAWPERIGVREARCVRGLITLGREDILQGRRRVDEVAVSTWPIELWPDHTRARFEYPEAASSVPLGALVSRSHPRLAMAGRCLSGTRAALGALRVIGTALATGEAAGVAAALGADRRTSLADVAPADVRVQILRRSEGTQTR